jgi:hypothetical protein
MKFQKLKINNLFEISNNFKELEIKKMAKEGNKQACVILAKQLVQLRKQETRSIAATAQISGIKTHTQVNLLGYLLQFLIIMRFFV